MSVPAHGEACSRSQCPQGKGVVAGTDAQASSHRHPRARSTASSARPSRSGGRRTPRLSSAPSPRTTSAGLVQAVHRLHSVAVGCSEYDRGEGDPGWAAARPRVQDRAAERRAQKTLTITCPIGRDARRHLERDRLQHATAPPPPGFATAIRVKAKQVGTKVQVAMSASEALPASAQAQVQVGVRCATG